MALACAVLALLAGGCAREEAPAPGESPKAAAVAAPATAPPVDPEQAALEKELAEAEQEVERWRKAGDSEKEIEALLVVGRVRIKMNQEDEAIATFERVLSRSDATGYRMGAVVALRNLGFIFRNKKPEEARKYLEEALHRAEPIGDPALDAELLHLVGISFNSEAKYSNALTIWKKALHRAEVARDDNLAADIWNGMGVVYTYFGESKKALEHFEKALTLARRSKNEGAEAAILTGIGVLHRRRGELERARQSFLDALAINDRNGEKGGAANVLNQLGGVYVDLGEKDEAFTQYRKALAIHQSVGSDDGVAWALFNIGQVYLTDKKPREALEKFAAAREPSRKGEQPRTLAAVLHGIGVAQLELEQTEEAVRTLEEALPLRRQAGNRLSVASTLLGIGRAYQKRGALDRAISSMEDALELARETQGSFIQAAVLFELAKLDRDRGRLQAALDRIEKAIEILESVRSDLPGDRLKSSFFASKRSYYDLYIDILMRLDRRAPGRGYKEAALGASERARARSLLDLLAEDRHEVTQGISPDLRRQEMEIAARLSQVQGELIDALSKQTPEEERVGALAEQLKLAEDERQELERTIRANHRRYAEVRYPSSLDLQGTQAFLDPDWALLEYSLSEEGSYLFLVTRDGLEVHPLPRSGEIASHVARVGSGVASPGRLGGYIRSARWLYEELVAPVRPRLEGKRILLIAADGPLHFLSFEALLTADVPGNDPAGFPYLLRDFALGYVPSASVLPLLTEAGTRESAKAAKELVAFADPVYGPGSPGVAESGVPTRGALGERPALRGLSRLSRLRGSGVEVQRIAALYRPDDVTIYAGEGANERNVKRNPLVETAKRLHFAAHGVLNPERPALSGLRLSQIQGDDGLLQVYEIFNLKLDAELVVLSACESGLGKEVAGEGLVGVTRAFLYAGAPSVVVSLWRVRDDTAPDLMLDFYKGLDQLGKAEALQAAKLAMIRAGRHSHPYYWAPFILVGRP